MKKKTIALLMAAAMLFAFLPTWTVAYAEGGDWSFGEEDLFSGNAQVFEGADGSRTEIFDNGSMRTTYPDGRKEGLDKDGNHFEEAKDGTVTFRTIDGGYGTKRPDGSGEGYYPDGSSEIYHADGTHTEYDAETGLTLTYDKDDKWTGVSLDEEHKIEFYDETGDMKEGSYSLTDKTGRTITYTHEKEPYEDGDGEYMKEFSLNVTDKNGQRLGGVSWARDEEGNETLDIKGADGLSITRVETDDGYDIHAVSDGVEYTETETTDESGNKTVTSLLTGDKEGHVQQTVVYDKDDNFVKMTGEVQWTEDGKTTTITNDDTHIYAAVENKDGSKSEHTVTYGENGKESVKSVHTYKDGSKLTSEVTGSGGIVTGRTDTFTDKNGKEKSTDGKTLKNADGSTIEFSRDGVRETDADGGKTDFTEAGVSFVNEDGSVAWNTTYDGELVKYCDRTAGLDMFVDPATGEQVFKNEKAGCTIRYKEEENGNPSGSIETKDGVRIVIQDGRVTEYTAPNGEATFYPDGSAKLTLADGRVLEADGQGNVFENGRQIRKDGVWVEGYGPAEEAGESEAPKGAEEPADAGFTGGYYGTYDYTAYWDGGKQKQGNRAYYVFEYNGCYYLVQVKNPDDVKNRIKEDGVEGFFHAYYDDHLTVENASFDPATRTGTYLEKSYMNDVQYISTVYTIVFDGRGGVTVSWESQNVAQSFTEPQESGTFTGSKK